METEARLQTSLASWQAFDIASYEVAVALGIIETTIPWYSGAKHVFWTSNQLGGSLIDILDILVKIGALESENEMYRWNPQFKWNEASSRPGR